MSRISRRNIATGIPKPPTSEHKESTCLCLNELEHRRLEIIEAIEKMQIVGNDQNDLIKQAISQSVEYTDIGASLPNQLSIRTTVFAGRAQATHGVKFNMTLNSVDEQTK